MLYASRDGDRRTLLTQGTNTILAKNRYSLPAELPLSWSALMRAMSPAPHDPAAKPELRLVGEQNIENKEN